MRSPYSHVFFDLDHTIWDFERNSWETLEEVWQKFDLYRLARIPLEGFRENYKRENFELWAKYNHGEISKQDIRERRFKKVMENFNAERILDPYLLEEFYLDNCPKKTSLIDGAVEVLEYLESSGYELYVLSNGFEETTHEKMENSGIKGFFKNTITSEGLGVTKPKVEFFEKALDISGSRIKETIMIGDNLNTDIKGAQNTGIDQIYFNPYESEHEENPTHEIRHLLEIKNIL